VGQNQAYFMEKGLLFCYARKGSTALVAGRERVMDGPFSDVSLRVMPYPKTECSAFLMSESESEIYSK
jgi:hypothetical protein